MKFCRSNVPKYHNFLDPTLFGPKNYIPGKRISGNFVLIFIQLHTHMHQFCHNSKINSFAISSQKQSNVKPLGKFSRTTLLNLFESVGACLLAAKFKVD
jgi:hypothetical protein